MAKKTALILLAALAGGGGAAFAQQSPGTENVPARAQATAPASADILVKQQSDLSREEMSTQADGYVGQISAVVDRIQGLQAEARNKKDIIRLNCLTDIFLKVKVNQGMARRAIGAIEQAQAVRNGSEAMHQFTRVTIINQKVQVLGAEAESCVGEDLAFVGATRVETETSADIPTQDVTVAPDLTPVTAVANEDPGNFQAPDISQPPSTDSRPVQVSPFR